jgi:alpha/beta hydrolase fold
MAPSVTEATHCLYQAGFRETPGSPSLRTILAIEPDLFHDAVDISGWWARPAQATKGVAIIHLHGGWFNWGAAQAFRNLVGQACYRGLIERGVKTIALSGDSAGGNLALVLLSIATAERASGGIIPVGAVALSPVTDPALTGSPAKVLTRGPKRTHISPGPRWSDSSAPISARPIRRIR